MTTPRMDGEISGKDTVAKDRRRSPRAKVDQIVYMNFQSGNGGIVLDVSSLGIGFQAADRVEAAQSLSFRLSPSTVEHIEITGQVVWLDAARKRGGLRLTHLPVEVRSQLQLWQRQHVVTPDADPAGLRAGPLSQDAKSESSYEAATLSDEPGHSRPVPAQKTPAPAQASPAAAHGPMTTVSGQDVERNASASTAWAPPAISPARTYSWEQSQAAFFDEEDSRRRRRVVTLSLIVALLLGVLGFLYFGNRRATGELLIRLGESISGERWNVSQQVPAGQGPSPSAEVPAAPTSPSAADSAPVSSDSVAQSLEASGPNANASADNSEKPQSPVPAESKNTPESTEHAETTSPRGDEGAAELAQARRYLQGSSRQDSALAAQLLWAAVGKGNSQAELELADLYLRGEGAVRKNCQQARILLTAAQNNRGPEASERLAHLRDYGCQ